MRVCDREGLSVAKCESETLVPTPGPLDSIIVPLLSLTQAVPCFLLLPVDVPEDLSVCQDDHHRCRTY